MHEKVKVMVIVGNNTWKKEELLKLTENKNLACIYVDILLIIAFEIFHALN